jgi:predicted nucleotidyltransferase
MRLTATEHNAILRIAKKHFGENVKVYLFGSRTDDRRKGGDIDLLIKASEEVMTYKARLLFLVDLKLEIGDQKIDVVFDKSNENQEYFLQQIKEHSIPL